MNILYVGQLGVRLPRALQTAQETRILELAKQAAQAGHEAIIIGTPPYSNATIRDYFGVRFLRKPSLNPERPGGWLYLFLSLWSLWRLQPNVVHFHGWRSAALGWLAALLSPESTFIWTVDEVPTKTLLHRFVAWQAQRVIDAVTAPNRYVQYLLLLQYGIHAAYIPDGYTPPRLKDLPLTRFGVRKGQYCVALAHSETAIRNTIRAYAATKSRKKLVILQSPQASWQRLINQKAFLRFIAPASWRERTTLLRNAAAIIAVEAQPSDLLLAMDAGRSIIAANLPLHQELLGVTGQYYQAESLASLTTTLKAALAGTIRQGVWGARARKRAQQHFTWQRILPEYTALYRYRELVAVPVDSVQPQEAHAKVRA